MQSAGSILRRARAAAGLTQTQLAERAGVTQSVISAYESGRREPALSTLSRMVDATGTTLVIELASIPRTPLRDRVVERRDELTTALRALGATTVTLFGSAARGEETPSSDIDLAVDVADGIGLFAIAQMRSAAERILRASVDVVPRQSLKPDTVAALERDGILL